MYFTNISDTELNQYHEKIKNNFQMTLPNVLTSSLFKIETIIDNSMYKIYPLFYCEEIISTNADDKIMDNKCIICAKNTDTFFIFKTENVKKNKEGFELGYLFAFYDYTHTSSVLDFCTFYAYNKITGEPLENAVVKYVTNNYDYIEVVLGEDGIAQLEFKSNVQYDYGLSSFKIEYNGIEYVLK